MDKDNTNKGFWEKFAKIYTSFMNKNGAAYDVICENLSKYIDDKKHVLELACGTGQITFRMAGKAGFWEATDYSENMIAEAQKRNTGENYCSNVCFRVQDATALTYDNAQFDVAVIANALHIMPNPDAALKEINRVLKPGGILFAPTFVYEREHSKVLMHDSGKPQSVLSVVWFMEKLGFKTYHKWCKDELAEYVGSRGFHVIDAVLVKGKPLTECVLTAGKNVPENAYEN